MLAPYIQQHIDQHDKETNTKAENLKKVKIKAQYLNIPVNNPVTVKIFKAQ